MVTLLSMKAILYQIGSACNTRGAVWSISVPDQYPGGGMPIGRLPGDYEYTWCNALHKRVHLYIGRQH